MATVTLTGQELAEFAKSKVGTAYIYGYKQPLYGIVTQTRVNALAKQYPNYFTPTYLHKIKKLNVVGKKYAIDCSGLISWYTGRYLGSSQLYSQAKKRLPISEWRNFAVGTVVWKSGHVGIYIGDGKVVEAKGIDYGVITSNIEDTAWKYGLTFSWIDYTYAVKVEGTSKGKNPYKEPRVTLKLGIDSDKVTKTDNIKWLQWELKEAGFNISIDGSFGKQTDAALRQFQQSSKLTVDGKCGPLTRKALIAA